MELVCYNDIITKLVSCMIIASVFMLETLLCNIISKHNGNNAAVNVMRHQTAIFELRIDLIGE